MDKYTPEEEAIISREKSLAEKRKQLLDEDVRLIEDKADWQIGTIYELYNQFITEQTESIRDVIYLSSILLKDALVRAAVKPATAPGRSDVVCNARATVGTDNLEGQRRGWTILYE